MNDVAEWLVQRERSGVEPRRAPAGQPVPREVPQSEVARGYEISPGRLVEITEEDLSRLVPEPTRPIDVKQFVSCQELDPIYLDSSYYVVPDIDLVRPFAAMLRAMQQTNRAAFCWVVLRSRRHLAAPQQTGQRLQGEFFLRPLDEFDHRGDRGPAEPSAR